MNDGLINSPEHLDKFRKDSSPTDPAVAKFYSPIEPPEKLYPRPTIPPEILDGKSRMLGRIARLNKRELRGLGTESERQKLLRELTGRLRQLIFLTAKGGVAILLIHALGRLASGNESISSEAVAAPIIEPTKILAEVDSQTARALAETKELLTNKSNINVVAKVSLGETASSVIKTTKIVSPEIVLAKDYVPPLVDFVRNRKINMVPGKEVQGNPEAVSGLEQLFSAAEKDGINLFIGSGYRSYSYQENLYKAAVRKYGVKQIYVAAPGQSQHQTGKAFDFTTKSINYRIDTDAGFEKTKEGKWLKANAWRFGFVLSYENEPWHFMYVGEEIVEEKIIDQLVSGSPTVYNSGVWEKVINNRLKGSIIKEKNGKEKYLSPLNPELNGNSEVIELIKSHQVIAVNPASFDNEYAQLIRTIIKSAEKQNVSRETLIKTLNSNPKLRKLANQLIGQIVYLKLPDGSFQKMVIMDTLGAGDSLSTPSTFIADFDQRFLEDVYRIVWDGKQYINKDTGKPVKNLPTVSLYG